MIEARTLELIHQEIDGENTPADSAALRQCLSANAEARDLFENLRRLANSLNHMTPADPPGDLADSILASIPRRPLRVERTFGVSRTLKYAYAAAAGLVLGILLAPMLQDRIRGGSPPDIAKVLGTMAGNETFRASGAIEKKIEAAGVTGTWRLSQAGQLLLIELDLTSTEAVEAVLEYDTRRWRLKGIEQAGSAEPRFQAADQRLSFIHQGRNQFRILMTQFNKGDSRFLWSLYQSGALLHQVSCSLPDPAAAVK